METPHISSIDRSPVKWRAAAAAAVALLGLLPSLARATGDFYEEPLSTLADYLKLDQLPAKTGAQIASEMNKAGPAAAEIDYSAELLALGKKPGPEALATIDKMIAAARAQADVALLNLLHDIRDLYAGPATAAETAAYLEWRMKQAGQFGVSFDKAKAADKPVDRDAAPTPANPELVADIKRHFAKASPALKPHWLYLDGAAAFRAHEIGVGQDRFLSVAKEYPKSPRAEAALYMAARCQMWRTRSEDYTQSDMKLVASERPRAKKLWEEYFAKYPHGRFYGDALGWYAAWAYDGHDLATALRYYAQQLALADHPELADMASEMVEKTLSHIASKPQDKAFAEVAKVPLAAQALVYLIVNSSESDNYNGKFDTIDEVRGWRKNVLPRLAKAIAAESKLYEDAAWKQRYLAMLALAASGAGQHDQAVKLLESAGAAAEQSDDLLMARGVALHRAKRPGEAAKALQTLLEKFPESPLAKGARLRLGLVLADDHRGGEAVLALQKLLLKPKEPEKKPDAADADKKPDEAAEEDTQGEYGAEALVSEISLQQVRALIDTLLNFAPVEELAAAAQTPGLDPVLRLELTEPIAQRLLAKEQFDEAKKYVTPAQFGLLAGSLEKLTLAAKDAKEPGARAAACLKLGDAWAAARGKLLTYPLDTDETRRKVYIDYFAEANVRRADSGPFIGAAGNYKVDLENRDELRHAFNWWLEASDAQPGTPQTAQALWRALKAMPQIADVSPFTYERAASRKWGDVARKLYDRLRTECADTPEAKRYAVTWDFAAAKKKKPEDEDFNGTHRGRAQAGISGAGALGIEDEPQGSFKQIEVLNAKIAALENEAGADHLAKLRSETEALQSQVRQAYPGLYGARWVNLVDDLALFLSEADPGAGVRKHYAQLRFRFFNHSAIGGGYDEQSADVDEVLEKDIKAALADPTTKPVADYFEFLKLAVIANHFVFVSIDAKPKKPNDDSKDEDTYRTRDYPALAKAARAFLEKYPQSKKREAALLLEARAVFRNSERVELPKTVYWPQAPRWEGGSANTVTQREPFEAKRVLAALDAYDRAYPHGRYTADVRDYRAAVALRQHDWKTALDLTLAQLGTNGAPDPDYQFEGGNRLGEIFDQLGDERYRADLLPLIKANAKAREDLLKYLAFESDTHPLLYLKSWLRTQLAAK